MNCLFANRKRLPEDTDLHLILNNQSGIRTPKEIHFKKHILSSFTPLVIRADRLGENVITFQSKSAKLEGLEKVKVKVRRSRSRSESQLNVNKNFDQKQKYKFNEKQLTHH